jgi:hypothetical protein
MMAATLRLLPAVSLAWLVACIPSAPPLEGCPDSAGCTTGAASTTDAASTTTTATEAIQTVTGGDAGSTSGPDETTGEPDSEPPKIDEVELDPNPIEHNGAIAVTVTAKGADGITMQLDTGDTADLAPIAPGVFGGEIPIYSGLANGAHSALLTPWRDVIVGETVKAPYTVALPDPGTQGYWETGDLIGQGQVAAMGVLPDGQVVELGTFTPNGSPRCYLRRRDKGGAWILDADVVELLPDVDCSAIDLKIGDDGVMHVLVNRAGNDGMRWWLARLAVWGAVPEHVGIGSKGETAVALALHPSGKAAACGFAPSLAPEPDDDAMAWSFGRGLPGETQMLDYRPDPNNDGPHKFSERTRDCVFAGDSLVLVGEVFGKHGKDQLDPLRDRLFILHADADAWIVAPPGVKTTQSGAQAVDVDDLGRLVIAGYACDDACAAPEGELRVYDGGELADLVPLGLFPTKQFAVQDLAWSPAGYAVVATGGPKGNEAAFSVRAFAPMKVEPAWTYVRKDDGVLHMAFAVAIGEYGEVYAGGFGANGYPAVAYIGG